MRKIFYTTKQPTQRLLFWLFVIGAIAAPVVGNADNEGIHPFTYTELIEEPNPTSDEILSLIDEFSIEYKHFMSESFSQLSEFYFASEEEREQTQSGQDGHLSRNLKKTIDKCEPEFDGKQIVSLDCTKNLAKVELWYSHQIYKNIRVRIDLHSLATELNWADNKPGTMVFIMNREKALDPNRETFFIASPNRNGDPFDMVLNPPDTYCLVESFEPFQLERFMVSKSFQCTVVLRESTEILKKLNSSP